MTPRASFVIPAYNAEAYLREAIDSCLNQSVKQVEVIVVNDGSTDGTGELIDFYAQKDYRVRPIHLKSNKGRSEARNIGNKAAKADVILVLDADDMSLRDRVKNTLTCFKEKNPDLMYGGSLTIDTFGNMDKRRIAYPWSQEQSLKFKTHFICHSTVAYRKGVTLNVQYQSGDCSRLGIDDWRFIWDCHLKGYKFAYIKPFLCYYRLLEDSISKTRNENEVREVKDQILRDLKVIHA